MLQALLNLFRSPPPREPVMLREADRTPAAETVSMVWVDYEILAGIWGIGKTGVSERLRKLSYPRRKGKKTVAAGPRPWLILVPHAHLKPGLKVAHMVRELAEMRREGRFPA